ncbi:hypothetical protein B296_00049068 [Ensete ventricosum]|uniref:Uncharacterized protein n=1 Tax=Ensete ventricosum TaxID=4639 RepID=A0A426X620_ENSVE|nr:hypothetical protein B296_00049068 [Ensete ventricosum]
MEFAFVPLKPPIGEEEVRNEIFYLSLKAIKDFRRQYRPFVIGVLSHKEPQDEGQWTLPESKKAWKDKWVEGDEKSYYAAWPVKIYCELFFTSNSLMLTFGRIKDEEEVKEWIGSGIENSSKDCKERVEIKGEPLEVSLKVTGGTKWCRQLSIEMEYLRETLEDEEAWGPEDSIAANND